MDSITKYLLSAFRGVMQFFCEKPLSPFPFKESLRRSNFGTLRADFGAAINVVLLTIPQGMAYAAIADVPIAYGIMSSAVAALVGPCFASSRYTNLGPTNATSLMLFSYFALANVTEEEKLTQIPILILMVGVLCLIGAFLKFADLLQFVSRSVLVGYITGASLLIISNQLKHILGVADVIDSSKSGTFLGLLQETIIHIPDGVWQAFTIGAVSLFLYFFLQRSVPKFPTFGITLVAVSAGSYLIKQFVPALGFDQISWFNDVTVDNLIPPNPLESEIPLWETIKTLLPVALALAFLASLENTIMSKSLATQSGTQIDVNQDMLSLGVANVATSFAGGMPVSSSLTRSALNFESGAKTGLATVFCGILCSLVVYILAQFGLVSKIPKPCLAAMVIGVALSLIKWENIRVCLQSTSDDAIVIIVTCLSALLMPIHIAIFVGVILSIILFLKKSSKPDLVEYEFSEDGDLRELDQNRERPNPQISIVHVEGALYFGAAELFRLQIQQVARDPNIKAIILRMKNAYHLDATSVLALRDLVQFVRSEDCHVLISGMSKDVYKVLKRSGVVPAIQEGCRRELGETNIFMHLPSNPNISTRDALLRAQKLLNTKDAEIKIYFDPKHKD